MSSVVAALRLFGGLNAGTPLEMASTPVSAVQPEENVRTMRNTNANPTISCGAVTVRFALSARNWSPRMKNRNRPQPIISRIEPMNA